MGQLVAACETQLAKPITIDFAPDGLVLAAQSKRERDTIVQLWNVTGEKLDEKSIPIESPERLAFSPNGQMLVSGGWLGARLWDVTPEGLQDRGWLTTEASAYAVAFSQDSALALGCADQTIRVWDLKNQFEMERLLHTSLVSAVAFSPDGQWIASASSDGILRLGDCNTGTLLVERRASAMEDSPGGVTCVAFSPDAKTLVSGGDHSELYFWNMDRWSQDWAGYEPQKCKGPAVVTSLAFASNDRLACGGGVTWSHLGSLTLWDLSRQPPEQTHAMECPETVRCVAYSPDAEQIAITYKFMRGDHPRSERGHAGSAIRIPGAFQQGYSPSFYAGRHSADYRQRRWHGAFLGSSLRQTGWHAACWSASAEPGDVSRWQHIADAGPSPDGWIRQWRAAP